MSDYDNNETPCVRNNDHVGIDVYTESFDDEADLAPKLRTQNKNNASKKRLYLFEQNNEKQSRALLSLTKTMDELSKQIIFSRGRRQSTSRKKRHKR